MTAGFSSRHPTGPRGGGRTFVIVVRFAGRGVRGLLAALVLLALLTGLPWALVSFVGWPLPDHLPSWDEVEATLLNPMSAQFLLNCLAVMCWILWLIFAIDVLRCAGDVARGITWRHVRSPGPVHGLAAALIGSVVLTLLGGRTAYAAAPATTSLPSDVVPVSANAPLTPGRTVNAAEQASEVQYVPEVDRAAPVPPGMVQVAERVRAPRDGVHDSLWRIAERIYGPGGGIRWPELFQLNSGVEQPDGRSLSNPNLVRPGWTIIAFVPVPNEVRPPEEPELASPPAPPTAEPSAPVQAPQEERGSQTGPGLNLMTGAFVSIGLAAAVTAAVMSARMWRRRQYRIGSGDRADLQRPVAPVIRALRTVDQQDDRRDDVELVLEPGNERAPVAVRAGVRDGRELAVSLAGTHGLGLAGSGARAAARALLLHLLAQPREHASVRVIVPVADFHHVFDGVDVANMPSSVRVVDSIEAALDELEAALLTRTRCAAKKEVGPTALRPLVLLASPAPHVERRLQAVLENGSAFGLAGILLGQWRPGATVLVRDDGTVRAASPGFGDALTGVRLFSVPADNAGDLLVVLREAEGPARTPAIVETQVEPVWPSASEGDSSEVALAARAADHDELSDTEPSRPRLSVSVMGRVQITLRDDDGDQEVGGTFTPKQREVLIFLALHPEGVRRDVLNEAVWPNSRPPRPYNSFHNTLSMLRRTLSDATDGAGGNFVLNEDGRYRLNSDLVTVDFWALQQGLHGPPGARGDAVALYRGDLAEDVTAAWAEPFRESVRRDVLDALDGLIRANTDSDPESALALLERARKLDRYNEGVYTSLIRIQARLGRYDAIQRTLALLTTTLDEIGEHPSNDILNLADLLQRRGSTRRTASNSAAAS